jgi:hypothetical protein
MPKKLWLPREATGPMSGHSGLDVTWTKSAQRLDFGGWYDSWVGIPGDSLTLREFFDALGITESDCAKAWGRPVADKGSKAGAPNKGVARGARPARPAPSPAQTA